MRFELIVTLDLGILLMLIAGLCSFAKQLYDANDVTRDNWIVLFKYFMFTGFVLTSFILEYSMFRTGSGMDNDNVYYYFLINRSVALVFTVISVWHSLEGGS